MNKHNIGVIVALIIFSFAVGFTGVAVWQHVEGRARMTDTGHARRVASEPAPAPHPEVRKGGGGTY